MVGYYEACKHQPVMLTVNDSVPGVIFSDKTVFNLSETICSEDEAHRFALITERLAIHFPFSWKTPIVLKFCKLGINTHVMFIVMQLTRCQIY
jgi:hypothetical protein